MYCINSLYIGFVREDSARREKKQISTNEYKGNACILFIECRRDLSKSDTATEKEGRVASFCPFFGIFFRFSTYFCAHK